MNPDWSVFDRFTRPSEMPSWAGLAAWSDWVEARYRPKRERLQTLKERWDALLPELGGDPCNRDWSTFRPLRLSREEDWSDWLAQLIEDSATGGFAGRLLTNVPTGVGESVRPSVLREVSNQGYRADLVIAWKDDTYSHIEVKVGDPNLSKTLETARAIERRFQGRLTRRADVVILLPVQSDAWVLACSSMPEMGESVEMLTWCQVALALRHSLLEDNAEPVTWRVWAHAFCGAVEQDLLGLPESTFAEPWLTALSPSELELATLLLGVVEKRNGKRG